MPMQATTTSPLFAATLRPDRSLRTVGGWIGLVIAGLVGTPLLVAVPEFIVPGLIAYGVAGTGLMAFNIRQSRRGQIRQQITLWADQLEIATTGPRQSRVLRRFKPTEVRLHLKRDDNERTTAILLKRGSEEIELGPFLSSDDKSSFAKAFGRALRLARQVA
ncbi:DUF2244 domain-containing protein [Devosia sp. PTR5]|uniref:DUF2244 domain-containing protein n=1 Tax=Devosia oryzisoli TaxID=2774138 RepID=A0A927FX12_9HYPH|nr:DUF2244 domain-containing protein [Devosia oryzisoli]MBD8066458.1 DUF2244 domain-containing protein [Devosia oryzisoli]